MSFGDRGGKIGWSLRGGMTTVADEARARMNAFGTRYLNREGSRRTDGPQCRMGGDAHRKLESRVWRYLECVESEYAASNIRRLL